MGTSWRMRGVFQLRRDVFWKSYREGVVEHSLCMPYAVLYICTVSRHSLMELRCSPFSTSITLNSGLEKMSRLSYVQVVVGM